MMTEQPKTEVETNPEAKSKTNPGDKKLPLQGLASPQVAESFDAEVLQKINQRSGGRFFGKKTKIEQWMDRLPLAWIALAVIVIGVMALLWLRQLESAKVESDVDGIGQTVTDNPLPKYNP